MLDKLDMERGKSFFLWHTFYSTGLLGLDKTPSQTTWKLRVEHKALHVFWLLTQKTEDRIVCGETSASSRPSMDRPLLRRRLRELCCGMDPIHPTAPTSSFSSSYCWYWSPEQSKFGPLWMSRRMHLINTFHERIEMHDLRSTVDKSRWTQFTGQRMVI